MQLDIFGVPRQLMIPGIEEQRPGRSGIGSEGIQLLLHLAQVVVEVVCTAARDGKVRHAEDPGPYELFVLL